MSRIKHPAYNSWVSAKARCRGVTNTGYYGYGARGITFSNAWDKFEDFWRDMGPTWFKGASIDRIDGSRGYGPGNCRWATPKEQANNRKTNRMIGDLTVAQFAEKHGLTTECVHSRLAYGWSVERLSEPCDTSKRKKGKVV